jgi:hypothetical protein
MKFASVASGSVALAASLVALSGASAAPGVVNSAVNLRQGPGTSTAVVAKIPGGAAVDVAGCSGEWCQVSYAGKNGYVIASALGHAGPPRAGPPPGAPPPGYMPPPGYVPPPGYAGPPPYPYPYYGPYYYGYGPYWGWGGGCCWRGGWGRRW